MFAATSPLCPAPMTTASGAASDLSMPILRLEPTRAGVAGLVSAIRDPGSAPASAPDERRCCVRWLSPATRRASWEAAHRRDAEILPATSVCLVEPVSACPPAAPRTVARPRRGEQSVPRGDAAGTSPSPGRSGGMYARSTTMRGNPQAVDDLITTVRDEVMPMLTQLDGCVGVSLLADR